MNMCHTRWQDP